MGSIGNQLALIMEPRVRVASRSSSDQKRTIDVPRDERVRVTTRKLGAEALRPPARPRVAMKPLDKPKR